MYEYLVERIYRNLPKVFKPVKVNNKQILGEIVYNVLLHIPREIKKKYGLTNYLMLFKYAEIFSDKHFNELKGKDSITVVKFVINNLDKIRKYYNEKVNEDYKENIKILEEIENVLNRKIEINTYTVKDEFLYNLKIKLMELVKYEYVVKNEMKEAFNKVPEFPVRVDKNKIIDMFLKTKDHSLLTVRIVIDKPFRTYCPICKFFVNGSEYLYYKAFPDDYYAYWFANLVKHYRHEHIKYYDLTWRYYCYAEKNKEYMKCKNHDEYKIIVNNRAKRQIIRAIVKDDNLSVTGKINLIKAVFKLQHNDEKTIELANKMIKKLQKT